MEIVEQVEYRVKKTRITSSIRRIYGLFEPLKKNQKYILAKDAITQLSQVKGGSRITLMRARKAMGIHAVKIAGSWRWPRPKFTLEQALANCNPTGRKGTAYRIRKEKDFTPVYVSALRSILRPMNYDGLATEIEAQLKIRRLHNNKFITLAKNQIGICKVWVDGHWHWILPEAPPVHEWLEELLLDGSLIPVETVMKKAAEKGWSRKLIWKVKEQKGSIKLVIKNGRQHWQDLANRRISVQSYTTPTPLDDEDEEAVSGFQQPVLTLSGGDDFAPAVRKSKQGSRTAARIAQLEAQVAQLLKERNITHD